MTRNVAFARSGLIALRAAIAEQTAYLARAPLHGAAAADDALCAMDAEAAALTEAISSPDADSTTLASHFGCGSGVPFAVFSERKFFCAFAARSRAPDRLIAAAVLRHRAQRAWLKVLRWTARAMKSALAQPQAHVAPAPSPAAEARRRRAEARSALRDAAATGGST